MGLRAHVVQAALIFLLLTCVASQTSVFAAREMQMQASFSTTQTQEGIFVAISGRVFELNNNSVSNAVISIQVNNPQGTSILVTIRYTDLHGIFQDTFLLPPSAPAGNYTAYLVADKPGYDTTRLTLTFTIATPDFSIESSISALSLKQGDSGNLTVTVLSLRGFNERVNLTAIDPPTGVIFQFNPSSIVPSGTATVNVVISDTAKVGNYTMTLLAVSGSLNHKTSFQLTVNEGPPQADLTPVIVAVAAIVVLGALALVARSRRRRRRREAVLEELLKQASADTGYIATARVIARLEELRGLGRVDEDTYQRLKKEYEKRLEKSR
jgi:uncharacterized membrane protein